jgi:hypothetical protein
VKDPDRLSLILFFSVATFFIAVAIIVYMIERHKRNAAAIQGVRTAVDALDIKGVRTAIEGFNEANSLEHGKMGEALKKVEGRTQFLIADKIAVELGILRDKHADSTAPPIVSSAISTPTEESHE